MPPSSGPITTIRSQYKFVDVLQCFRRIQLTSLHSTYLLEGRLFLVNSETQASSTRPYPHHHVLHPRLQRTLKCPRSDEQPADAAGRLTTRMRTGSPAIPGVELPDMRCPVPRRNI
ncbi:hypothetical protein AB1N83_011172 [Pleurotus pulmonarius]